MFKKYSREEKSNEIFRRLGKTRDSSKLKVLSRLCTWETIQNNLDVNWKWKQVCENKNVTWENIQNIPNYKHYIHCRITNNPNITFGIILQNLDLDWNWYYLSKIIDFKHIKNNPKLPWKWILVSTNHSVDWEIVKAHPNIKWDYKGLSMNKNITFKIVKENPDKDWDFVFVSMNPSLTFEIVKENPDEKWNWDALSCHENITYHTIMKNPNEKWNLQQVMRNPNVTLDIARKYGLKPHCLIHSNLTLQDYFDDLNKKSLNVDIDRVAPKLGERFSILTRRKYLSALKIKRWWLNFSTN